MDKPGVIVSAGHSDDEDKKTHSSVDISREGRVGYRHRTAVGVPGIGRGKEPEGC